MSWQVCSHECANYISIVNPVYYRPTFNRFVPIQSHTKLDWEAVILFLEISAI
jgi:hypothetical protein